MWGEFSVIVLEVDDASLSRCACITNLQVTYRHLIKINYFTLGNCSISSISNLYSATHAFWCTVYIGTVAKKTYVKASLKR